MSKQYSLVAFQNAQHNALDTPTITITPRQDYEPLLGRECTITRMNPDTNVREYLCARYVPFAPDPSDLGFIQPEMAVERVVRTVPQAMWCSSDKVRAEHRPTSCRFLAPIDRQSSNSLDGTPLAQPMDVTLQVTLGQDNWAFMNANTGELWTDVILSALPLKSYILTLRPNTV
jgi:hypothetical protein